MILVIVVVLLFAGCSAAPPATARANAADWFVDRAEKSGLDFVHVNGMSGKLYFPEMMGPGVALFDYDNDGDLDVYLVQGGTFESPRPGRLFRNDLHMNEDGTTALHFTDVTDASGLVSRGYGMGVATGDFDNDGCVDLYLTNFGRNQMFRNNCDGTFTDVSRRTGTDDDGWSVSATFLDFDRDGWLDLYVGHYVNYSLNAHTDCFNVSGKPDYCSPNAYRPQASRLYHNNRNGTFTDVTAKAGMAEPIRPGLGVVAADFNGDGWVDIYVANDGQENQLWMNQRNGTFKNDALLSGSAMTAAGRATGSMGVDAADFDGDGHDDLIITTLTSEGSSLFLNNGSGMFEDQGSRSGLRPASLAYTGFGAAAIDVDNDGWLDVMAVNGAVRTIEALAHAGDPFPLRQKKQLFRNRGDGKFDDVSDKAGAAFQLPEVGRGAAFGDIDNDGDTDVVVANNNGPARLLLNEIGNRHHWIGLRVPVGARIGVARHDGSTLWRRARADGSYASANDPRVLVGLGTAADPVTVRVLWPSGRAEEFAAVPIDRYTTLKERK